MKLVETQPETALHEVSSFQPISHIEQPQHVPEEQPQQVPEEQPQQVADEQPSNLYDLSLDSLEELHVNNSSPYLKDVDISHDSFSELFSSKVLPPSESEYFSDNSTAYSQLSSDVVNSEQPSISHDFESSRESSVDSQLSQVESISGASSFSLNSLPDIGLPDISLPEPLSLVDASSSQDVSIIDSQPILSSLSPIHDSNLSIIEEELAPKVVANVLYDPSAFGTSVGSVRPLNRWDSGTAAGVVHASWEGELRRYEKPLFVRQVPPYSLRSATKALTAPNTLLSVGLSRGRVSRKIIRAKRGTCTPRTPGKPLTFSSPITLYEQHLSALSDPYAFKEPSCTSVVRRKRPLKGGRGRGSAKRRSFSLPEPVPSTSDQASDSSDSGVAAGAKPARQPLTMATLLFDSCLDDEHAFQTQRPTISRPSKAAPKPKKAKAISKPKPDRAVATPKKAKASVSARSASPPPLPPLNVDEDGDCDFLGFGTADQPSAMVKDGTGGETALSKKEALDMYLRKLTFHLAAERSGAGLLRGVYFYTIGQTADVNTGFYGIPKPVESLDDENEYKVAILRTGSQRGGEILIDYEGKRYCRRGGRGHELLWYFRCRVGKCAVAITFYVGQSIEFNDKVHSHGSTMTYPHQAIFLQTVREAAVANPFQAPHLLVSNLLRACGSDRLFVEALGMGSMTTSFYNATQTVRRTRAKYLPPELKGIFDPLDMEPFPHIQSSFVRFDLKIFSGPCYGRFIGLASKEMLKYLFHAKVWFVDGTFRVVKDPFIQLLVIHVSFSAGNLSRSIPVFFILMTGRKTVNYQKCFETLLRLLTDTFHGELGLCKVMMDFEYALWACFRSLMANGTLNASVKLRGCVFHYAQALFRKVQSLGLTLRYFKDAGVRHIITSFMHLPYLPIELVAREFDRLSRECTISLVVCEKNSALSDFLKYVRNTWIFGSRFQIKDFCQYRSRYRTNNISE